MAIQLRLEFQRNPVADEVSAITAVVRPILTGLLYAQPSLKPFEDELNLVDEALATLPQETVRPPKSVLEAVMEQLKTGKGMTAGAGGG